MKTINKRNLKNAPKTLYMVRINMGGLVHNKIYELKYKGYGQWWDKTGDYDIGINTEDPFYKNKTIKLGQLNKTNTWDFVSDKKEECELFLLGVKSLIQFMNNEWFKYYE